MRIEPTPSCTPLRIAVIVDPATIASDAEYAGVGGLLLVVTLLFGAFFAEFDGDSVNTDGERTTREISTDD